jgi:glycosyltransferase involved in cell wall biosynthesis
MTPFFSVIIPTYNRADMIGATIRSFLNQDFFDFEVIVVDDGGDDNTKEIVESFCDGRIRYFWKENKERAAARNFGASLANGKYLNFFDSDDIAYPKHLSIAKQVISNMKMPDVFHLGMEICTKEGKIIRRISRVGGKGEKMILKYCYLNPNSVFVKYSAWEQVKFNEERSLAASEDWVFFLQLSMRYKWIVKDDFVTSYIVQHEGRSMNTSTGDSCYRRAKSIRIAIDRDHLFAEKLSKGQIKRIYAEPIHLTALHYALERKKWKSIKALVEAGKLSIRALVSIRTLAIVKYLLLKW